MRLTGFLRSGRILAPLIAVLVVLGVIYGGGSSSAGAAYGYSAVILFPVLAWQSKLLLDAEPDVQRHLARVTVGARRELAAGLLAATVLGLGTCAAAMVAPWLFGGIGEPRAGELSMAAGIGLGVLAHLLAVPAAVALGALASRAVTRSARNGVAVLVSGSVLAVVLGLQSSVMPWAVPPIMAMARALVAEPVPSALTFGLVGVHALLWCTVVLVGYTCLRRRRS
jgi:hypothetical protein